MRFNSMSLYAVTMPILTPCPVQLRLDLPAPRHVRERLEQDTALRVWLVGSFMLNQI
jgi:hypothetical protein